MASWTMFKYRLSDGLPIHVLLAEHAGKLWGVSLYDDVHPRSEDEFLWRIDPGLPWHKSKQRTEPLELAVDQLAAYFAGTRCEFVVPLHMEGTPFQVRVWQCVIQIPFGKTVSYGEIAELIGHPAAVRAVGNANGECGFEVVVPCHRVIAAGGKLGGYGNSLGIKSRLLAHEAAILGRPGTFFNGNVTG